jgi:hypothetical protein
MSQLQSFYDADSFYERLTLRLVRERIGHCLRERYEVPNELPPKMVWLVRKLDDDRDWLFPSGSWQDDVDLFGGRVQR